MIEGHRRLSSAPRRSYLANRRVRIEIVRFAPGAAWCVTSNGRFKDVAYVDDSIRSYDSRIDMEIAGQFPLQSALRAAACHQSFVFRHRLLLTISIDPIRSRHLRESK